MDFATWTAIQNNYNDILKGLPEGDAGNTAALYPGYVLTPGLNNNDVLAFQTYLNLIGKTYRDIPEVPAPGSPGHQTEGAVRVFQDLFGIPVSGVVGAPTWDAVSREYNYIRFGTQRTG